MAATRCFSSRMLSGLLEWRNPHGREENWQQISRSNIPNYWKFFGKVVSAEIGICLLTIASAVESVAYAALSIASLPLRLVTDKPYTFCVRRLQSSSFTIIWGIADAIIYNPLGVDILTRESFARFWADDFNPTPIRLCRFVDELEVAQWAAAHLVSNQDIGALNSMPAEILSYGRFMQEAMNKGAAFLTEEVLSGVSSNTLRLFKEVDPSVIMPILTRAVYICAAGAKRTDEPPDFFKPLTKDAITSLRQTLTDQDIIAKLEKITAEPLEADDLDTFASNIGEEALTLSYKKLQEIASGELQDSLFLTKSWAKALEMLQVE